MNDLIQRQYDHDVFLSYSHIDEERVRRLAEQLREARLRVWFDEWSVSPGEDIQLAIQKGLFSSRRVVACWSKAYLKSEWGRSEIHTILFSDPNNTDLRFIPVLLEDCDLPDWFRRFKYMDFRQESEEAIRKLISVCREPAPETGLVQSLHVAEDRFLQLLLSEFSLHRWPGAKGVEMHLSFSDDTPAIWNSQGKRYIFGRLDEAARERYQEKLDDFLLRGIGDRFVFPDPQEESKFLFRYGSAGTLPIITFDDDEQRLQYYCVFYRDVYPIGWNIANGGTDNRAELLNPEITMERELREELLIADFANRTRYIFPGDAAMPLDHPAHAVARGLWRKKHLDLDSLKTKDVAIEWQRGPDSLHIRVGQAEPFPPRNGFYLNINGDDFGIEVDRIATIHIPSTIILFDGELEGSWLVNSPVGLFEVDKFNDRFLAGETNFRPDLFFFDARKYENGGDIDDALKEFRQHVRQFRTPKEIEELQVRTEAGTQYGLCPVTAGIIERYLQARS